MEQTETTQTPNVKSNGPVVGIIIVVIVLAIGGYFFYSELRSQKAARPQNTTTQNAQKTDATATAAIEDDLRAEDFSSLEAELDADLQELEQVQ